MVVKLLLELALASNYLLKCLVSLFVIFCCHLLWKQRFGLVKVNCWFCNSDAHVANKEKNSWLCKHCQQYNGFDKNGDYNKFLPEMYDESLNNKPSAKQSSNQVMNSMHQKVVLCEKCSRNQVLKFKQLSQFKPINENNFENELEEYKQKFEKLYSLCSACQNASSRFIRLQDTMLRGQLISQNAMVKRQDSNISTNSKLSNANCFFNILGISLPILYHSLMLILILLHSSLLFNNLMLNPFNFKFILQFFFKYTAEKTLLYSTAICGLVLAIPFKKQVSFHVPNYIYLIFWIYCFGLMLYCKYFLNNIFPQLDILKTIEFLLPKTLLIVTTPFISILYIVIPCSLMIACCTFNIFVTIILIMSNKSSPHFFNNKQFKKEVDTEFSSEKKLRSPTITKKVRPQQNLTKENFNESYCDKSFYSEDEDMDVAHCDGDNLQEPDLNCSLNALRLQDSRNPYNTFNTIKNPSDFYIGSALPSTLNTPPPSRSSSLLSISSHHSIVPSANPFNKFGSTSHFAKPPDDMPFQRYKVHSNKCSQASSSSIQSGIALNYFQPDTKRNFHPSLSVRNNFKKPLVSPAKLSRLTSNSSKSSLVSNVIPQKLKDPFAAGDYEHDISANDSASQVGVKFYPELSDSDDCPCTPVPSTTRGKSEDLNSSSPKSTISNFTSITMKSIAKVENSRLCRWILVVCLLLNLILVALLVLEVKEMRDMEQWKSKTSL